MNYYYGFDSTYILVVIGFILSMGVSAYLKLTYAKYSKVNAANVYTASEVVQALLRVNNINDVRLGRVAGNLTDHYAPTKKIVNLSDTTYNSRSIAAIGVAAHECGHVLQDYERYPLLVLSMRISPAVAFCSNLSIPIIVVSILLGMLKLAQLGVWLFAITLFYQILTLPIELDASRRAVVSLRETGILNENELYGVKKVLTAAALTYVAAAINTFLQLLRFVIYINNRRR